MLPVRPAIRALTPYSSARSEFTGPAEVFLDANENPFPDGGLNRYPDPLATPVREALAALRDFPAEQICVGNGSDELVDHLVRICCSPGDAIITCPPVFGMYEVAAGLSEAEVIRVPLTEDFHLRPDAVLAAVTERTKLLFICTPNNPSGNDFAEDAVLRLIREFPGIVVVDEAYYDFAERPSYLHYIDRHPNLVVIQTLSKAWGLAAARVGFAFAGPEMVGYLRTVKMPYNVNQLTQERAAAVLCQPESMQQRRTLILSERDRVEAALPKLACVEHIFPSDANYILVRCRRAEELYRFLLGRGIVVRNQTTKTHCAGCLRFTIGLPEENDRLLAALGDFA